MSLISCFYAFNLAFLLAPDKFSVSHLFINKPLRKSFGLITTTPDRGCNCFVVVVKSVLGGNSNSIANEEAPDSYTTIALRIPLVYDEGKATQIVIFNT